MPTRSPAFVTIEPELFDDRCRVTVTRYKGRRCIERDVYEDLTTREVLDLLEGAGLTLEGDGVATAQ